MLLPPVTPGYIPPQIYKIAALVSFAYLCPSANPNEFCCLGLEQRARMPWKLWAASCSVETPLYDANRWNDQVYE